MRYYLEVIKTFRDNDARRLFERERLPRWALDLQKAAFRKLLIIDAAENLGDLRIPPGNRLEKLSGNRAGTYSIRINDQWRICFEWRDGDAYEVEVVDYH